MYYYIFDPRGDKEIKYFERVQGRLLNLLSELKIDGEATRTSGIRTVELLVEQALGAEAKTIVVVGSDNSLNKVINAVVKKQAEATLGFIPLDPESALGKILGTAYDVEAAARTIASRLTRELDLGQAGPPGLAVSGEAGEHYFLSKVDLGTNSFARIETGFWGLKAARSLMQLQPFVVKLSIEGSFTATSEVLGAQIINSRSNEGCRLKLGDPSDGLLDILLLNKLSGSQIFRYRSELASGCLDNVPGATVLHARKIEVLGPRKLPLSVEGQTYTKAPASIRVAERKIKMIVGKSRQF